MTEPKNQKSILLALVLGLLLPGLGLFYAAPWLVALVATVFALSLYKLIAWIPLIGSLVMGVTALCSAGLGVLYARAYNRQGRRVRVTTTTESS